jgi:hypothetical protein
MNLIVPEPIASLDVDWLSELFDDLPIVSSSRRPRTWTGLEGLSEFIGRQSETRQMLQLSVPSIEAICGSLEVVLPYFDLASDELPNRLRQRLCKRIRLYAVRYRRSVQAMLHRADAYLPMIKRILRLSQLPTYYAYVPLVESAFQVDAKHHESGARGLWQLMRTTARTRGLTVSKATDERLHPRRSTEAAVDYLAYLYKRFGDYGPLYVLAAYNYGETNLRRKMRRFRPVAVTSLYRPGYLPGETREYLLRMMTIWVIAAHPERFHFLLREAADLPIAAGEGVSPGDTPVDLADISDTNQ